MSQTIRRIPRDNFATSDNKTQANVFHFPLHLKVLMSATTGHVRKLPLHQKHAEKGARFGQFGDWEVPLYYSSILEEHTAVRTRAGVFDISHMGEFFVSGSTAGRFLDELLPRSVPAMENGQAWYMPLLNEKGGIVDDIIVYRYQPDRFLLIVNAGNIQKDFSWIQSRVPSSVQFENGSDAKGLLALQGPDSAGIIKEAFGSEFAALKYYHFQEFKSGIIARTGYTGEDGFEIMVDQTELPELWDKLFQTGSRWNLVPVGFGARDTLRLEAGMPLYGHDMSDETTPLEARIGWAVDLNKKTFVGREPLLEQKQKGLKRRLIGFEMLDRGVPRQDYEIMQGNQMLGKVTSGSFAPTLGKNIGMGYVPVTQAENGREIEIKIRGSQLKAKVVQLPFYKRNKTSEVV